VPDEIRSVKFFSKMQLVVGKNPGKASGDKRSLQGSPKKEKGAHEGEI
jgi:hypothetical protein